MDRRIDRSSRGLAFSLLVLMVVSAGCRTPLPSSRVPADSGRTVARKPVEPKPEMPDGPVRRELGNSVEGRPIEVITIGSGPDHVLILASIHGDEAAGTALVERLAEVLDAEPDHAKGRRVVLVPVANPDGVAYRRRHNVRGVDLNRNFPAGNYRSGRSRGDSALSEPESRALMDLILEERPARVVSIHQPLGCIDYDGPAKDLAELMAQAGPLPVRKLGSRPGSLGSWVGLELRVPIITLELPRSADGLDDSARWEAYGDILLAAIAGRPSTPVTEPAGPNPEGSPHR